MARGAANPYWGIEDLSGVDAEEVIAFANLSVTPELWAKVTKEQPGTHSTNDTDEELDKAALGWLVWDEDRRILARSGAGLREAKRYQRELRAALDAIIRGDATTVARQLDRGGPFLCHARRERGSARTPARWHVEWLPAGKLTPRSAITQRLLTVLRFADRLGRCNHCQDFFLSERRWKRPRRFCDEQCKVTANNERRLKSGYFTEQRRKQRAQAAREITNP